MSLGALGLYVHISLYIRSRSADRRNGQLWYFLLEEDGQFETKFKYRCLIYVTVI